MVKIVENKNSLLKKRNKLIICISIFVCLVFGVTIGLTIAFRQNVDPNFGNNANVALIQRQEMYFKMKQEIEDARREIEKTSFDITLREKDIIEKGEYEFINGYYNLLDANVEFDEIIEYTNKFVNDPDNKTLFETYRVVGERNTIQIDVPSTRGSEKQGTYSPTDKRGIDWLYRQLYLYAMLGGCVLAVAIVVGIAAVIGALPTLGLSAAAGGSIVTICGLVTGLLWGLAADANNAIQDCVYYAGQNKTYSIYRNYILFGAVTTGYVGRA